MIRTPALIALALALPLSAQVQTTCQTSMNTTYCNSNGQVNGSNSAIPQPLDFLGTMQAAQQLGNSQRAYDDQHALAQQQLQQQQQQQILLQLQQQRMNGSQRQSSVQDQGIPNIQQESVVDPAKQSRDLAAADVHLAQINAYEKEKLDKQVGALIVSGDCKAAIQAALGAGDFKLAESARSFCPVHSKAKAK